MTLSPIPVEKFGGLDLVSDPAEIGWNGAIDLLNVDLSRPGLLSTRPGSETWATPGAGDSYNTLISWYPAPAIFGYDYYIVGGTTKAYVLDNTGTVSLASGAFTGSGGAVQQIDNGVLIGTPSSRRIYVTGYDANNAGCIPQHYNGSAWTTPGTLPKARLLGATPWDNRLIGANTSAAGGPAAATSSESHVWFSDAGAPDTWGANNFVQLTPGDGEPITAICTWRDMVFVFKRSKFFVFYGTSTDSNGNPIFNYRTVNARVGAGAPLFATAGEDGVYFLHTTGIYKTTGGEPVEISAPVRPLFENLSRPFCTVASEAPNWVPTFDNGSPVIAVVKNVVYAYIYHSITAYALVGYPGGWSIWTGNGVDRLGVMRRANGPSYLANGSTRWRPDTTTTETFTSRYRSGFSDLGSTEKKVIREWRLTGSGSPTFQTSYDFGDLEDTGARVPLGTSPDIAENRRRYAVKGRQFSFQIGGTSPWSVNNLVAHVQAKKLPGDT